MKIVVTGGSGQLGSLVLERLSARADVRQILSLDIEPPRLASPKLEYRIADLRDPGIGRALEGASALVHLAFIVTKRAAPSERRAANVEGSRRIFEAAAAHGVPRIVYTSSVAAYGMVPGQPVPIVETTERRRTGYMAYADEKYEVEEYLDAFERIHPEITVVRLRPGIFLGRRIPYPSARFVRRRVMPFVGDARRPFVWDEDVADAVVLALGDGASGAYNLAAENPLPTEELARLAGFRPLRIPAKVPRIFAAASSALARGPFRGDPSWLRAALVELVVSSERARAELGWRPRYPAAADVATAFGRQAPAGTDPRIVLFALLTNQLARGTRPARLGEGALCASRLHLDVTGPTGADFDVSVRDGTLRIRRGIPRPPDATVSMTATELVELLAGRDVISAAVAEGRVRILGQGEAASILSAAFESFRLATDTRGPMGELARGLSRWCSR